MAKEIYSVVFLFSSIDYSIALVIFPPGRIIGGEDASIRDFPYQLSLEVRYRHICGAAILNEKHALTAAHCTSNPASAMTISGGSDLLNSPYRKRVDVKRYVVHPEYDENSLEFDIAVLFLLDPLVLNGRTMQPVALPTANDKLSDGTMVKVSGWGVTHQYNSKPSNKLQVVEVPMVNTQKCTYAYRRVHKITGNMICAGYLGKGGKDSCQGRLQLIIRNFNVSFFYRFLCYFYCR